MNNQRTFKGGWSRKTTVWKRKKYINKSVCSDIPDANALAKTVRRKVGVSLKLLENTISSLQYLSQKADFDIPNMAETAYCMILEGEHKRYKFAYTQPPTKEQVNGIVEACRLWQPYCQSISQLLLHSFKRMLNLRTSVIHAKQTRAYVGNITSLTSLPPASMTTIVYATGRVECL